MMLNLILTENPVAPLGSGDPASQIARTPQLQAGLPFSCGCDIRVSRQKGLGRGVTGLSVCASGAAIAAADNLDDDAAVVAAGAPWTNLLLGYAALRAPRVPAPAKCLMSTRLFRNGTPVLRKAQTLTRGDN